MARVTGRTIPLLTDREQQWPAPVWRVTHNDNGKRLALINAVSKTEAVALTLQFFPLLGAKDLTVERLTYGQVSEPVLVQLLES